MTAAAVLVLVGCSGGETANETLPSTSSTATDTSEALPPLGPPDLPMPAEAREQTPTGAEAFLSYYVQLMNHAITSLRTDYIRELSADCASCLAFASGIDDVAEADQVIVGAEFFLNGSSEPLMSDQTAEYSMSLTQRASELRDSAGQVVQATSQAEVTYPGSGMMVTWDAVVRSWRVSDLAFQ